MGREQSPGLKISFRGDEVARNAVTSAISQGCGRLPKALQGNGVLIAPRPRGRPPKPKPPRESTPSGAHEDSPNKRSVGRPHVNLDPWKDEIIEMYQTGVTNRDISKWLADEKSITIEKRTLVRRLVKWNVPSKKVWSRNTEDEEKLKEALYRLVLQKMDDGDIYAQMKEQGFNISRWHVRRLRKEMGLRRRHDPNTTCEVCKKQGRYPKEGCLHQTEHPKIAQRKSGEVSASLRDELRTLKKQVREMQSESKKKEKEKEKTYEQLQKENQALREQLKSAAWSSHTVDPALGGTSQYAPYAHTPQWNP